MHRRQFLCCGAAVGGALLGRKSFLFARRNLGFGGNTTSSRAAPPRDEGVTGEITGVDGTSVEVSVTCSEPRDSFEVVVHRREYPTGELLGRGVSDQFRAPDGERSGTVSVTVPREESEAGTWFYEAYVRPAAAREVDAYLCESGPLQWARATRSEVTSVERVTDARPAVDGAHFSRHLEGNDYVLSYRWQDSTGALWKADYRLRRSTHEAAVAAERGYTTTYEESLSNPVTRDFAATLAENAERISDDARDDTAASGGPATLGSLDAGKRFNALVQFVQGMRYARDAESLDTYDYHRTNEETLVVGGGDRKDLTYLLAGLLEASFDCGTALLFQAGHLILGVDADGVASLPYAVDTTKVGGREFLVLDPSLTGPIDFYPDDPFVAAYADGEWFHADASAAGAGIDDVVRDYVQKTDVTPQVF